MTHVKNLTISSTLSTHYQFLKNNPKLVGFLRLVRLSNSLPASALVLMGAKLVVAWPPTMPVWQAAVAMWCVTAFGYTSNDLFDITEDRINKPDRPLPSGAVTRAEATTLALLLALSTLVVSWAIGPLPLAVAALVMLLLTIYNRWLKGRAAQGNLLIGLLAGCTFFVGGISAKGAADQTVQTLLLPAMILAVFVVTREILKTIEDEVGDSAAGRVTVTTRWSSHTALQAVTVGAMITITVIPLPYWLLGYSAAYVVIALIGVVGPLLFSIFYLWRSRAVERVQRSLALLKASYFLGLLAFWFA